MAELTIKRQAIAYPPRISLGTLRTIEAPDYIGNQIAMFCATVKGERPLLPNYGLPSIVHTKVASKNEIIAIVLANLRLYFRGIEITIEPRAEQELGLLELDVNYISPLGYGTVTVIF